MRKIHGFLCALLFTVAGCGDVDKNRDREAERHKKQATTYLEQGQLRASLLESQNYLRLAPEQADAYLVLASIYNRMGAYTSTQQLCSTHLSHFPDLAVPLAQAYVELKKYRSALDVLNTYPPRLPAQQLQQVQMEALSYIALGDNHAYEETLNRGLRLGVVPADIAYIKATAATAKGNLAEAEALLLEGLLTDEDNLNLLESVGANYLAQNNLDKAEQTLSRTLALLPKTDLLDARRSRVLGLLIDTLIQQGRTSEAYAYQKIIADANPEGRVAQQRFDDALELYRQGKSEKAEAILNELRVNFSGDKGTATLLGIIHFEQGRDLSANTFFDEVIDPETTNASLIQAAAVVKYRTQQADEAFELLKKSAEVQPNNALLLTNYGLAWLDRDPQNAQAVLILQKSLAIKPDQPSARIAIARHYLRLGQGEQALAQLQKAYQENPLNLVVQQAYLQLLYQFGETQKISEEIAFFRARYPANSRADFIAAWFAGAQKNYAEAETLFTSALSSPDNAEPQLSHAGLAYIYEQQNNPEKSYESWLKAIAINPAATAFYKPWIRQAVQIKQLPAAKNFLVELTEKTHYWQPVLILAELEAHAGNLDAAIDYLESSLDFNPQVSAVKSKLASLYQIKGGSYRNAGLPLEAKSEVLKAVNLYPESPQLIAALIDLEIANKNLDEAGAVLQQLPQKEENKALYHYLQGVILRAKGRPAEAMGEWRSSWDIRPSDTAANAMVDYLQTHQPESVTEFIEQWLKKLPDSHSAILLKAMRLQNQNKPADSVRYYERALAIYPDNPVTLNNLAWLYYEIGDVRAQQLSARAVELFPNNADILDTHGWLLVEAGKVDEGAGYLERAASISPENADIREHLVKARARLR